MGIKALEKKVRNVELKPTARKIDNLSWVRYDIEDIECETVDRQTSCVEGSKFYKELEELIDTCNALYERIENLERNI
jgi:hypothetical protein